MRNTNLSGSPPDTLQPCYHLNNNACVMRSSKGTESYIITVNSSLINPGSKQLDYDAFSINILRIEFQKIFCQNETQNISLQYFSFSTLFVVFRSGSVF